MLSGLNLGHGVHALLRQMVSVGGRPNTNGKQHS